MERSRELRGIMLALYDDWSRGDASWTELFADDADVLAIGTDPSEWWPGGRNIRAVIGAQISEMGGVHLTPTRLQAFTAGNVGWVADDVALRFEAGPEIAIRITAVLERRDASWKIVQWHASIGQSNEESIGMELTTSIEALAEWADEAKPDLSPSAAPDGTVTIAFTDIEASTALNEALGDSRWLELIRHHDETVRRAVSSHGGSIVKGAGDGFMLAFPAARKSIECAIELQRTVSASTSDPVRIRVGVHTGEPIRHENDFFGRDVAYAARVGAVARGGQILVSHLVRELCAGASFDFAGPAEHEFKGFEGPQQVYAVNW